MDKQLNNEVLFDELVYKEKYGVRQVVKENWDKHINLLSFKLKIMIMTYKTELNKQDLEKYDFKLKFSSFDVIRKSLKELDLLDITKKEGKVEFYITSSKGVQEIKSIISNFVSTNDYVKNKLKSNRQNEFKGIIGQDGENQQQKEFIKDLIQLIIIDKKIYKRLLREDYYFYIEELIIANSNYEILFLIIFMEEFN